MSQVTIYVRESALDAAKAAASRAEVSISQWFAQYAEAEERRSKQSWTEFFAEIDRLRGDGADDFLSLEEIRSHEVPDLPRESWQG